MDKHAPKPSAKQKPAAETVNWADATKYADCSIDAGTWPQQVNLSKAYKQQRRAVAALAEAMRKAWDAAALYVDENGDGPGHAIVGICDQALSDFHAEIEEAKDE